jgi:glycosyltransferase involved in cell wall biosynthesis
LVALDRCLAALQRQDLQAEFEIIVADNNSPEGAEMVSRVIASRARMVVVEDRGAGPARNGGVAIARGEILAFTDSDCVPEPAWLREGLTALGAYDFVGGRVVVLVDDDGNMTPVEAFERVFAFDFQTYIKKKGFTGAGNFFCRRALFDIVGGFRTGVSEDVEWSHRATGMGFKLGYVPRAVVGHPARRTWEELESKWRRVNVETYRLYQERPAGITLWCLRSLLLPLSALLHMPKVFSSDQLKSLKQKFAAVRVLWAIRLWRMRNALSLLADRRG